MSAVVEVHLKVNGVEYRRTVDARLLLADFLREDLELTGTHLGCSHGACGACTIWLDGRSVRSCLLFAAQANGHEVSTIEGLRRESQEVGEHELHPLQEAFCEENGIQCGFCTPGLVMTALEAVQSARANTDEQIARELCGNICRCTGYEGIIAAVRKTASDWASTTLSSNQGVDE